MSKALMAALKMITEHATKAQGHKLFGNSDLNVHSDLEKEVSGTKEHEGAPTVGKDLDESAKAFALQQDANHAYPYPHMEPDGDEDAFGHEPPGPEEEDAGDEHVPQLPPEKFSIMSSRDKGMPSPKLPEPHGLAETAKRRRGRPRKSKME